MASDLCHIAKGCWAAHKPDTRAFCWVERIFQRGRCWRVPPGRSLGGLGFPYFSVTSKFSGHVTQLVYFHVSQRREQSWKGSWAETALKATTQGRHHPALCPEVGDGLSCSKCSHCLNICSSPQPPAPPSLKVNEAQALRGNA